MRYFITFSYNGTDFHGSQSQPNGNTVQAEMEAAFATILRQPVPLTFAGRTDAGVHAEKMVAHFDVEKAVPANFGARLNNLLPPSIAVQAIQPVRDDAHARFDATARTYRYRITTRKDPFLYVTHTRVAPGLDFEAMNQAAALLIGKQDFASFCRVHTDVKTTICDVREAQWVREKRASPFFSRTFSSCGRAVISRNHLSTKYLSTMRKITLLLLAAAVLGACTSASKYQTTKQKDIDALTKLASFEMPKVPVPSFPDRTFNILDYGADNTGVALATEAIQKAIDECTAAGGGTVIIPEGIYTTGPITLKSNVRLFTEKNSFIVFSHDLDLYRSL